MSGYEKPLTLDGDRRGKGQGILISVTFRNWMSLLERGGTC